MLMFAAEGPRSVDERDVIAVYRDSTMGGYYNATVIMASGEEISGRALPLPSMRLQATRL